MASWTNFDANCIDNHFHAFKKHYDGVFFYFVNFGFYFESPCVCVCVCVLYYIYYLSPNHFPSNVFISYSVSFSLAFRIKIANRVLNGILFWFEWFGIYTARINRPNIIEHYWTLLNIIEWNWVRVCFDVDADVNVCCFGELIKCRYNRSYLGKRMTFIRI